MRPQTQFQFHDRSLVSHLTIDSTAYPFFFTVTCAGPTPLSRDPSNLPRSRSLSPSVFFSATGQRVSLRRGTLLLAPTLGGEVLAVGHAARGHSATLLRHGSTAAETWGSGSSLGRRWWSYYIPFLRSQIHFSPFHPSLYLTDPAEGNDTPAGAHNPGERAQSGEGSARPGECVAQRNLRLKNDWLASVLSLCYFF